MKEKWLIKNKVCWLLVGDGIKMAEVKSVLSDKKYNRFVILTGLIPQHEAPKHLAASDILLSPHINNTDGRRFFGSPTKLFEYMASLTPIVVSRLPAIEEIVGEDAVYFFKADDTHECKVAIEKVFRNPGEALTRAARAKNIVEGFSWKHCASVILDMMKS